MKRLILVLALILATVPALPAAAVTYASDTTYCPGLQGAYGRFQVTNLTSAAKSFPKAGMSVKAKEVGGGCAVLFDLLRPTALVYVPAGATVTVHTSAKFYGYGDVVFSGLIPSSQSQIWSVRVIASCG